jgi:hypothetical protein
MHKHSKNLMTASFSRTCSPRRALNAGVASAALAGGLLASWPALAQNLPITSEQRSTAQQVAQAGVPLSELAPNSPEEYTVKRGDTLWAISGLFLSRPWRWPELWGMNIEQVRNPHRIYPGQHLVLEKLDGRALLRLRPSPGGPPSEITVLSPRTRIEPLADTSLPTLQTHLIEPFLAEPVIIDEAALLQAPRIVAAPENRVLITRGDRAYARGLTATPLVQRVAGRSDDYRVFRNARPLRNPVSKAILGYEAQYLGKASLVRSERLEPLKGTSNNHNQTYVVPGPTDSPGSEPAGDPSDEKSDVVIPATIDIVSAKEEMRVGDRLLPEPPRQFLSYVPHAPAGSLEGTIVSVYGDAVAIAGQNQVVVIDKGTADGVEAGHVMAILKDGGRQVDRSQPGERSDIKLPDERNGLLMVFRPFEKLSYALILEITDTVKIGDHVANPR